MKYVFKNGQMVPAKTAEKKALTFPCLVGTQFVFSTKGNVKVRVRRPRK